MDTGQIEVVLQQVLGKKYSKRKKQIIYMAEIIANGKVGFIELEQNQYEQIIEENSLQNNIGNLEYDLSSIIFEQILSNQRQSLLDDGASIQIQDNKQSILEQMDQSIHNISKESLQKQKTPQEISLDDQLNNLKISQLQDGAQKSQNLENKDHQVSNEDNIEKIMDEILENSHKLRNEEINQINSKEQVQKEQIGSCEEIEDNQSSEKKEPKQYSQSFSSINLENEENDTQKQTIGGNSSQHNIDNQNQQQELEEEEEEYKIDYCKQMQQQSGIVDQNTFYQRDYTEIHQIQYQSQNTEIKGQQNKDHEEHSNQQNEIQVTSINQIQQADDESDQNQKETIQNLDAIENIQSCQSPSTLKNTQIDELNKQNNNKDIEQANNHDKIVNDQLDNVDKDNNERKENSNQPRNDSVIIEKKEECDSDDEKSKQSEINYDFTLKSDNLSEQKPKPNENERFFITSQTHESKIEKMEEEEEESESSNLINLVHENQRIQEIKNEQNQKRKHKFDQIAYNNNQRNKEFLVPQNLWKTQLQAQFERQQHHKNNLNKIETISSKNFSGNPKKLSNKNTSYLKKQQQDVIVIPDTKDEETNDSFKFQHQDQYSQKKSDKQHKKKQECKEENNNLEASCIIGDGKMRRKKHSQPQQITIRLSNLEIEEEEQQKWDKEENIKIQQKPIDITKQIGSMKYLTRDKENKKKFGHFARDKADIIINHKLNKHENHDLEEYTLFKITKCLYKVTWQRRPSGTIPQPSYYTYSELRKVSPRLLLDYLEQLAMLKK